MYITSISDGQAGSKIKYSIKAIDVGGNESEMNFSEVINIPKTIEKFPIGDFESKNHQWYTREWEGGKITFTYEENRPLAGKKSAKLYVEESSGIIWHTQFGHYVKSFNGMKYTLTFTIRSDKEAIVGVLLQQTHEPYSAILAQTITANQKAETYTIKNHSPAIHDSLFLTFMCGKTNKVNIYIDDIKLTETSQ